MLHGLRLLEEFRGEHLKETFTESPDESQACTTQLVP